MNERALRTLEFLKIVKKLEDFAVSPMGKEKARELRPTDVMINITIAQEETSEAVTMIFRKGNISLGGLHEIRPQLNRAAMGGTLTIVELLNIAEFLYVCRKVKNYSKNENKGENYPRLDEYFNMLTLMTSVENEIARCIISEVEISDDASQALARIRRDIKTSNDRIREQLNSIIYSASYKNMLQDAVVTIRNDRYCVPIKSEYRNSFPGMIHDQSNTGSTLFMEPNSVVQLNNKIKELQLQEKEEIERILSELSQLICENKEPLAADLTVLTHLDFLFAKANLSLSMEGSRPLFNLQAYINIKRGRHPLLNPKDVVPIDIYLGRDFSTLLITGPNTGGKTVALKTLGLFTMMGQAGLHIPAKEESQLAVFDQVFADIGDEQSIEQSLSTFSAHMSNIVNILKEVTPRSLVLFDELGAGTDPTEGAALAMAIIEKLHRQKIRTAVTTHYSELKVYALSTKGIENACCEFSVETLRPTYRLLIGIPGKSNAFAISKRLGLEDDIVENAKEFISHEDARLEDVITDLEISKKSVAFEQERAEQYRQESERLKREVEKQTDKTREQQEKILSKAREEAKLIYATAKEEADRIIKDMNRDAKEKAGQQKLNESRSAIKEKLSQMQEEFLKSPKKQVNHKPPENLQSGERVYVISFDQNGTAITLPDRNNEVMVQIGSMKVKVPLGELVRDSSPKQVERKQFRNISTKAKINKAQYLSAEIDCRGQMVEEALGNIDKYLDDAYLSGIEQVMIIHGKGTGALRSAVQQYLRSNPHVRTFRPGVYGEGEAGVTVVEMKV